MSANQKIWIHTGYDIFAVAGPMGIKVEDLARRVGISKSSFYHHFADLEVFMGFLLTHHLQQSKIIAVKEKSVQNIDPELIHVLLEHKADLLFNRQLRINKQTQCFEKHWKSQTALLGICLFPFGQKH